jgi:hypothetical protein
MILGCLRRLRSTTHLFQPPFTPAKPSKMSPDRSPYWGYTTMAYSGPRHGGWPQTGRVDDGWPQKSQVNDRRQEAPPQNIPAVRLRSPSIELCERESSSDDDGEISFGTDLECWHYDLSAAPALNRYGQSTPDMYWPSPGALDPTTYTFPNQHRPRNAGIVQSEYQQHGIITR